MASSENIRSVRGRPPEGAVLQRFKNVTKSKSSTELVVKCGDLLEVKVDLTKACEDPQHTLGDPATDKEYPCIITFLASTKPQTNNVIQGRAAKCGSHYRIDSLENLPFWMEVTE